MVAVKVRLLLAGCPQSTGI